MGTFGADLAMQLGSQAVSGVMGMAMSDWNDKRQVRQQRNLQDVQMMGNKAMVDYNMQKQYEMWQKTNYEAQVEQMKKAGINPALLYGMGGGGGTTTGEATGNVEGARAPAGGREIQDMMGMGMQMQLLRAQKENIEADTANKRADIPIKEATVPKLQTETASIAQGITNQKTANALMEIETNLKQIEEYVKGKSQNLALSIIASEAAQEREKLAILENDRTISDNTKQDKINTIRAQLIGIWLDNALTNAQTTTEQHRPALIETQRTAMIKAWVQKWKEIELQGRNTDIHAAQTDNDIWVNDMSQSTKLPVDLIQKALQAIILKNIIAPGRNPIQGFKTNH